MPGAAILTINGSTTSGGPADPQNLNRYTYVGNNPVNRTDPSGHDWEHFWQYAQGVVAGATAAVWSATHPLEVGAQAGFAVGTDPGGYAQAIGDQVAAAERGRQLVASDPAQAAAYLYEDSDALGYLLGELAGSLAVARVLGSGRTDPLYTNPTGVAHTRATALQDALPAASRGRVTIGAGVVEESGGMRRVVIGTSEPGGYLRPGVKGALQQGEIIAKGTGHAEANIVNWAASNQYKVIAVGAGRPVCPLCARSIETAGGIVASPRR